MLNKNIKFVLTIYKKKYKIKKLKN